MKSCRECKHFEPTKDFTNLWGLIKTESYYFEFAKCGRPGRYGRKSYCTVQRAGDWDQSIASCNSEGRGWEPKNE